MPVSLPSPGPAGGIDSFLKSMGSPMAGLGKVFVAVGQKYNVDPRLLVGISGAESSFGKHILGSYNAWGWGPGKPFASWEQGISTVAQGLQSGYLSKGLTTPYQIGPKYAPASDGNNPQHWADTVTGFMQKMGANVPTGTVAGSPSTSGGSTPIVSSGDPNMYAEYGLMQSLNETAQHGGHVDPYSTLNNLAMGMAEDYAFGGGNNTSTAGNAPETAAPSSGASFTPDNGPIPKRYLSSVGPLHQTEGLPGFPAHDYFATAGTPAVAPVTGKVVRLSGHSPAQGPTQGPHGPFGWSVYIQGTDGHEYYLTHMGSRSVQVGQTVRAGQQIGTVGNYAKYGTPSHIHMGVH